MIPFNFDYYRPQSISEAVKLHKGLSEVGKSPVFFAGGTEIITLGRLEQIYIEAVIDIKDIPECQILEVSNHQLIIGSSITLTHAIESDLYPLLSKAANEVADRTVRNKITVGGNICGYIYYREALLPFLLADSEVILAGPRGYRHISIHHFFKQRPLFEKGEFLVQIITDQQVTKLPFYSKKVRKQGTVGYPLVTVAALNKNGRIHLAMSGLCPYPFRAYEFEDILNNEAIGSLETRWNMAVNTLPHDILNDIEGSAEYRLHRLKQMVFDIFKI